ncbi:MAG TPA: EAL domain-containing response regulator [Oculatellaceae cyanobacterium]|jgi:EAL domain-containing protein (putative c-di-GMP-specific phosphodiesterase class I)/ActR/RegA family two-component response regulator
MNTILVIEDEELVRENILDLLDAEGFDTINASNGTIGVELAKKQKPDLIICDVMMPDIDGYGVLNILRQNLETATIPFIFLTAKAEKSDFRQGMNLGADDYLTKPYQPDELLGIITTRLKKRQAIALEYKRSVKSQFPNNSNQTKLESSLRLALERQEFEIYYQPQISLQTGKIIGAEALLRWHQPEQGLIPPVEFIPIAERTNLIIPIGEWVLRTACQQIKNWQNLFPKFSNFKIAVNVSAVQFNQKDFTAIILDTLSKTNLHATCLELELTETTIMKNVKSAIQIMNNFKSLGICISIDDFGIGYSSLSYVQDFNFDTLKIDRAFVKDVTSNPKTAALTQALIGMARSLNLNVIAEGVETEEELKFLLVQGCDAMQGYLFSRPLPVKAFEQLLQSNKFLSTSHT